MRILLCRLATVLIVTSCVFTFVLLIVVPVKNWIEISGWESHEATLENAEIVSTSHNTRDKRLSVIYRYRWKTETHKGYVTTPYHHSQGMPLDLQRELLKQFKAEADQKTLRAFVNPDDPTQSVLTRDFYPAWFVRNLYTLLLTLYFSFGVFCIVRLARESGTDSKTTTQDKYESPSWKFIAYFAGFFSLLSIPVLQMIIKNVREGDYGVLTFLMFPVASIGLWWLTRHAWVNRFDINRTSSSNQNVTELKQQSE